MESGRQQALQVARLARNLTPSVSRVLIRETDGAMRIYAQTGIVPNFRLDAYEEMYRRIIFAAVPLFGEPVVRKAMSEGIEVKSFADFMREVARRYIGLEVIRRRIFGVAETTRRQIVDAVDTGYRDGLGQEAIATRIVENAPTIARRRAGVIARTETHGAANYGAHEAARQTGLPLKREWVSVDDHRTRNFGDEDPYDHRRMAGQVVGMDEAFQMPSETGGTVPIMFPGDPEAPLAGTINCRCTVAFRVGLDDLL